MRKGILATILLGLVLVLSACGGGNTDGDDTNATQDN